MGNRRTDGVSTFIISVTPVVYSVFTLNIVAILLCHYDSLPRFDATKNLVFIEIGCAVIYPFLPKYITERVD
jgi:hypothetical protein